MGSGDHVSFSSGIRINNLHIKPDVPSGFRFISDPSKGVGTNIEGDVLVHGYLTW